MGAAVEGAVGLDAVADDLAPAVRADRRELVDRALEAVEGVAVARRDHLERQGVVISADLPPCPCSPPPSGSPDDNGGLQKLHTPAHQNALSITKKIAHVIRN